MKFKVIIFSIIFVFLFSSVSLATDSIFVWSGNPNSISQSTTETSAKLSTQENPLKLESGSAILIEQDTGNILYSHNVHEKLRPASVTKVMSILLIMEALDNGKITLTDIIPCSENAHSMGGSQIWLDTTETLTVHEMLKSICVVSANDYKVQLRHKKI